MPDDIRIIYNDEKEYTDASNDELLEDADIQRDESGQVVIYTGIFEWKDGTYRSESENNGGG